MNEEILRVLNKFEDMKWITVSPHIVREAMAQMFLDEVFKGMTVKKFIEVFYPNNL